MILYGSAFSPFSRKVRLALELKRLEFEFVDGLDRSRHEALRKVNGRVEVPVLVDGRCTVVNSADIVAYLEHRYPETPLLSPDPELRAKARKWERCADTLVDAVMTNISYWHWTERSDEMPEGMLDAAREDLGPVYDQLEAELGESDYVCGTLSIADVALFIHLVGARALGVPLSRERHRRVVAWLGRLRKQEVFRADLRRASDFLANLDAMNLERQKIFWRGDRIEWVLARGFESWLFEEIRQGRATFPPQTP